MASLIGGYNYDIFISYRQKDNKGDRWVSEFVEALKTELESTFKEDISVYFDINPHDGLLETHDVDASLKDKLKCLIFIPIISRTYCDPKSFAWEHEFKAFIEQASKDIYGLKIKLPNGNVANRVLPIRIYDLDDSDIKLCESVIGSVLRGVEFIYKSVGVNRPLRANEDHPQDNSNKTYYRDQINKVANAIREIITAIDQHEQKAEEVAKEVFSSPLSVKVRSNKTTRIIAGSLIGLALIISGILFIPKQIKPSEQLDKSIAVLPFVNDSPDKENEYFCNGMMEEILNQLQKIGDLRVKARTSSEKYRDQKRDITEIGKELKVSLIMEGSVRKIGEDIRITVQLINAKTGDHIWSEIYDGTYSTKMLYFQSNIAKKVASSVNAVITPQETNNLEAKSTTNMLAYDLCIKSGATFRKFAYSGDSTYIYAALALIDQALTLDPKYIDALKLKTMIFSNTGMRDSALFYCRKIESIDPTENMKATVFYVTNQPDSLIKYLDESTSNNGWTYLQLAQIYLFRKNDAVKGFMYFQKVYDAGFETEPEVNMNAGAAFAYLNDFDKAKKYFAEAFNQTSGCLFLSYYIFFGGMVNENYDNAFHLLDSVCSITACGPACDNERFKIYILKRDFVTADKFYNKIIIEAYKQSIDDLLYTACLLIETNRKAEAIKILNYVIEQDEKKIKKNSQDFGLLTKVRINRIATAYTLLGDNIKAFEYLLLLEKHGFFQFPIDIRIFPGYDRLRNLPEFQAMLKRIEDQKASLRAKVDEMRKRGEIDL